MNPAAKQRWVAALRSGEYEQGHGQLRIDLTDGSRYCCLGVLCEVEGWDYDPRRAWAPDEKSGLRTSQQRELAILNDDEQRNFAYIADYIEEEL